MRKFVGLFAGLLLGATGIQGEPPAPQPTLVPSAPITVFQIDLVPGGTGFSIGEPVLEGDVYVFRSLLEKTISRIPKSKVKEITRRTTDLEKEVLWQIELAPRGRMLSSEEPVKRGTGYVVKRLRQGPLVTVPEGDVKKITRLVGIDALRAGKAALGAVPLSGERPPVAGGGTSHGGSEGSAPASARTGYPGNWGPQGKPGGTDAAAPPTKAPN